MIQKSLSPALYRSLIKLTPVLADWDITYTGGLSLWRQFSLNLLYSDLFSGILTYNALD